MPRTTRVMNKTDFRDGVGTMIDENPASDDVLVMWENGRTEQVPRKLLKEVSGNKK